MTEQAFESINPANEDVFATTRIWADGAVEKALEQTARQSKSWARTSLVKRCALLEAVADQLDSERDRLAGLVTAEMGKLAGEARAEVEKCAWV